MRYSFKPPAFFLSFFLSFFVHKADAQSCDSLTKANTISCLPISVPHDTIWECGGSITGTTVSTLISPDSVLLDATLAATIPQYVILHGQIAVDVDYKFAPGSVIIFTADGTPGLLDGFVVQNNKKLEIDSTHIFGKKQHVLTCVGL